MEFVIDKIFLDDYPEEAAAFCNANGLRMAEIEPEDGHRRFQIQEVPELTAEQLAEIEDMVRNSPDSRLADIENALIELAEMIAG